MKHVKMIAVALLGFVVVACGAPQSPAPQSDGAAPGQSPGAAAQAPAKKIKVAFSQCNSAEPYRTAQNNIMKRDIAKYLNCELVIQDAQQDNAKQIAQIENMILQKVDVLIVAPNEAAPLTDVVKRAHDAGIKVVCLERNLMQPVYDVFVGANNVKIGEMAGQRVADYVKSKGIEAPVVVEMKGLLGTKPQEERHDGARRFIDAIPGVKVIEDVADWLQGNALKRMETILQANPKIDVVYAHNDPMAVGCYLAAKNAGREKEMIFVGVDGLGGPDGGVQRVLDGMLDSTFYYPTCAAEGLEIAIKLGRGESVPQQEIILEPAIITKENAQEWYGKVTVQ
ncbi:MAG TPA: substrate-binding domain-containing protein [Candidatus Hydrogenedentes bacterium]|nr:substrate-binding domain-containing protein [Candidatus Hydrogenedentota bacterium]HOS01481.1 substrate-binding domain-containing protein [Candidatus Hydrogenedentota bacterium]